MNFTPGQRVYWWTRKRGMKFSLSKAGVVVAVSTEAVRVRDLVDDSVVTLEPRRLLVEDPRTVPRRNTRKFLS